MATSKCELKITIPSKASQKTLMEYSINSPIGERVRRKETQRFITGTGRYVDDLLPPGTLQVAFARSSCAHAKISNT